jgi:hypothetical protein
MECWNVGILGIKAEIKPFNYEKLPSFNFVQGKLAHYSNIPFFHYSNWAEALNSNVEEGRIGGSGF